MPIGPFGEILGTTDALACLGEAAMNYKTKVIAPRNPKLIKGEPPVLKLKPSQYMFQMSLDTEKKLANTHTMSHPKKTSLLDMSETTHQKVSAVNIDEPMFQPYPSEIFFQKYSPFETYEVPLTLRNNDKVPRLIRVTQENTPYFQIISPLNVGHKVGPGLPTVFKLQFTPEEKRDYYHELICITERERFVVPVKCIGSRAILDLPDKVHFPDSPVKYNNSKTLFVRNIGDREAKFSLSANKPFKVEPENGVLPVDENMQITIEFNPLTSGDHKDHLVLHYDTGEDIFVSLYGAAIDSNVRLDKNSLRIEGTYLSMANQRTISICNRSDVIAHYRWTKYATIEEEEQQKILCCTNVDTDARGETDRFLEECIQDPTLRDKMSILNRTFQNRKKLIQDDELLWDDDVMKIEPREGDIWPNSSIEVQVIFKPDDSKTYTRTAFCDVTGRESRLPLRIRGDGVGPKVQLSYDELDMGNVYVRSNHVYEVVLANKGDIDAIFSIVPNASVFGPKFSFNPSEGILMPDGHQAIQISFNSEILGDFCESFYFQVDGASEQLKLIFKGTVIGPTFHFNVPSLNFGTVSYGFPYIQSCILQNTSLVPMHFKLRVPGDGIAEGLTNNDDFLNSDKPLPRNKAPQEFFIDPSEDEIPPASELKIKVKMISNTIKKYDYFLVVDVDGVGNCIVSLPISARCTIPNITVLTPLLDYGRCFLRHPYEHQIHLQNDTELPSKYQIVPQQIDELTNLMYTSPEPVGIIDPHSVCHVPLIVTPHGKEELEASAQIALFGSPDTPLSVNMVCFGEGPVVHINPLTYDWGTVQVLKKIPKIIKLSNESLIPAKFTARMARPKSAWKLEPKQGEIPPEETIDLVVTACINDSLRFEDRVLIEVEDGHSGMVPVHAYGRGTTIVPNPPMTPDLNLGPCFCRSKCIRAFTLKNSGRRHQTLIWTTVGYPFLSSIKKPLQSISKSDMKYKMYPILATYRKFIRPILLDDLIKKSTAPPPDPPQPIFTVTPYRLQLNPGESVDVEIRGTIEEPQTVKETLVCHAIIGGSGGKETVLKVNVTCEFISPLLQFDKPIIEFRQDKQPNEELEFQFNECDLNNVSTLPLTAHLELTYPFQLIDPETGDDCSELDVYLGIGEKKSVPIKFDPAYKDDSHSRIVEDTLKVSYREHPHVDELILKGEVNFPNLHFEKDDVDFGCILNDTEVTRYINITNNSPMDVRYKWSFLVDQEPISVYHRSTQSVRIQEVGSKEQGLSISSDLKGEEEATPEQSEILDNSDTPLQEMIDELHKDESIIYEEEKRDSEKGEEEMKMEEEEGEFEEGEEEADILKLEEADDDEILDGSPSPSNMDFIEVSTPPKINPALVALLEKSRTPSPIGVEQIFDILPIYGLLKPGDSEQITLTFYGHADMGSKAKALCEVEGGPIYEVLLKGEASLVQYSFDCLDIDYGKQSYDLVAEAEIVLSNDGMVGYEFVGLGMDPGLAKKPKPGVPVMIPHSGYIEAYSQQTLIVRFLAGIPEKFHKSFQIQVGHFEPDTVNLFGEGVFPRISLDLPRYLDEDGKYENFLKEAKENLTKETRKAVPRQLTAGTPQPGSPQPTRNDDDNISVHENPPSDLEIQMEVERLMVQEHAIELQEYNNRPNVLEINPSEESVRSEGSQASTSTVSRKRSKKPKLADYVMDFGHVVLGTVKTHIVRATNTGWFPVSFSVKDLAYENGFCVQLDRVRQLPGAPDHETVDFVVSFDPRGAGLGLGVVESICSINIVNGPQFSLRLRANVTMPDMQISTDTLDFGDVKCGECKVITIQIHNHKFVRCGWSSLPSEKDKRADRHVPLHLRRKVKPQKVVPQRTFEMMPSNGALMPGQRQNVQVKFMPTEQKSYEMRINVRLSQSSQRILLLCRGQGLEPHVEFDRNLVEFGPILPHSAGDEQSIIIRNPCPFPIEIYNLEFDKSYLEEEKILRLMKGYDEHNTILLPPRDVNEKLPSELLGYYDEQIKKIEDAEKARREAEDAELNRKVQEEGSEENASQSPKKHKKSIPSENEKGTKQSKKEKQSKLAAAQAEEKSEDGKSGSPTDGAPPSSKKTATPKSTEEEKEKEGQKTDRSDKSKEKLEKEKDAKEKDKDSKEKDTKEKEKDVKDKEKEKDTKEKEKDHKEKEKEKDKEKEKNPEEPKEGEVPEKKEKEEGKPVAVGELEVTPVSASIARHLGIDLSPEGKAARNRRGIAIIVHGAPLSGKSATSVHLAKKYEAALLTLDGVILEAISNGNTSAGLRARELCAEAAHRRAEELKLEEAAADGDKKNGAGGLSVEALTAHTQGTTGGVITAHNVAQSMVSNRKTSTISEQQTRVKGKDHHGDKKGAAQAAAADGTSQVTSSPPPLAAPIARRLSVSASVAGEEGLMSCVLPEELVIEILAERLMLNDCHRGIVFDGLESLFTQNMYSSALSMLKALNNRKYIYFTSLKLEYNTLKEQERRLQEERENILKKQTEEEMRRLEEMSEDEYDALDDEEKADVDKKRLEIKKLRLKKEKEEREERQRREQEIKEAELKRLEEEKAAKKKKKGGAKEEPKDGKKTAAGKEKDRAPQKSQEGKKTHLEEHMKNERPDSHTTERGESSAEAEARKKKEKGAKGDKDKRPISNDAKGETKRENADGSPPAEDPVKDTLKEADLLLVQRFRTFEHSQKDLCELIERWERALGAIRPPTPSEGGQDEDHPHPASARKGKKGDKGGKEDKNKAVKEKEKEAEKKAAELAKLEAKKEQESMEPEESEEQKEQNRIKKRLEDGIGIPHIMMECTKKESSLCEQLLATGKLATVDEVLDGLGLGVNGPPIPPPATFAVVPFPVKRHAPPGGDSGHYSFIAAGADDPNITGPKSEIEEPEAEEDKAGTPDPSRKDKDKDKDEHSTPTSKRKGREKETGKDKKGGRNTSAKSRAGRHTSAGSSPPPAPSGSDVESRASSNQRSTPKSQVVPEVVPDAKFFAKLRWFRWVIPPSGEVTLRLTFQSEELGQFDQTLNFEIMGTRRRYQLYCRGICAFPTISREPRIVFPNRKKSVKLDEIVAKKYILTTETFEFGPLLVGKSRDRYKEGRYPDNYEQLTILNTSPLESDISFCYLNDSKGETFLLDPPTMVLQPAESQVLTVWAYPKVAGPFEDALVCCVKENPEPIVFKVLTHGVRPELELDKQILHFDKVLLHRKDTKTLYLRNSTLLPVAWRINGLENLGDDFSVSAESGVIPAKSEFALHAYFRAMKQTIINKKSIRLEVSDVENIMGLVQTVNVQIFAEAYDVALDMSFPKGADGGIDFDTIRVYEEAKQQCTLKNKGKYEIMYSFHFEPTDQCPKEICDLFSVIPQKGNLTAVERPVQVQVIFKSNKEVTVKEQPILKCQVIEPNIADGGETIASIPIKVSVKSAFSKYAVSPASDINFGCMLVNSRKTRTFTVENKGDKFDFKYSITRVMKSDTNKSRVVKPEIHKQTKSRDGSSSGMSVMRPKRSESIRKVYTEKTRVTYGKSIIFTDTLNASSAGQLQDSNILKSAFNRNVSSNRHLRKEPPLPVEGSAFVGQRNEGGGGGGGGAGAAQARLIAGMFTVSPAYGFIMAGGHQVITVDCVAESPGRSEEDIIIDVTGRDPNDQSGGIPYKLMAEACVPAINIQDVGSIFEEHRVCKNLSVWQHSHEIESCGVYGEDENRFVFNNVLVGAKARARYKISNMGKVPCDIIFSQKLASGKTVSKASAAPEVFELEPARAQIPAHSFVYASVTFVPPSMQSYTTTFEAAIEGVPPNQAKGRNLVFDITGEGNLPRIAITKPSVRNKRGQPLILFRKILLGKTQTLPLIIRNAGTLVCKVDMDMTDPDGCFTMKPTDVSNSVLTDSKKPHTASAIVDVGEAAIFNVEYKPSAVQRSQAQLRLTVINNQYEDTCIQMVGEGYVDDISLNNIHSVIKTLNPEDEEGNMAGDDVEASKSNHIRFGDCFINEGRTLTFTMTNHSNTDCVRFQWPDLCELKFAPRVGHLHGGCAKDMSVTFKTDHPKTLNMAEVPCKITKVNFDKPVSQVSDWDDRLKIVKWVDAVAPVARQGSANESAERAKTPDEKQKEKRPIKKKVTETELEPIFQEIPDSARTIDLLVSVTADYSKYKCNVEGIWFRDTLMFQTRVYEVTISNEGKIGIEYNWEVFMDTPSTIDTSKSITFANAEEAKRPATASAMTVKPESECIPKKKETKEAPKKELQRPSSSSSTSISEVPYTPFFVEPESGTIPHGKSVTFKVKFSPLDVQEVNGSIYCRMNNLEEGQQGPVIRVKGKSLMPFCHFELEDSDYLRSARRHPELSGPNGAPPGTNLDPSTKVIEFKVVGIGVKKVKKFYIINPTHKDLKFHWTTEKGPTDNKKPPDFQCLTPDGKIKSGKKTEVIFEFVSSKLNITESFWQFELEDPKMSIPFLLVGDVRDPEVSLARTHMNYRSLLIGQEADEILYIVNNEDYAFKFHFDETSLHSAGYLDSLVVEPMIGEVPPRDRLPVRVNFTPVNDKEVNFNLICWVKKKLLPLNCNIKAEGYSMNCIAMCDDSQGNKIELSSKGLNELNFGQVEIHEKAIRNFTIVNCGKFNFNYEWSLLDRSLRKGEMVSISPMEGSVAYGERTKCQLDFCPPCKCSIRGCELVLKILHGPTFVINVTGSGVSPGLHFSFNSYNFGPRFVYKAGMPVNSVSLVLVNKDKKEISVDCLYTPTAHLSHKFEARVLAPRESVEVPFTFLPRSPIKYHEKVTFEVNGLSKKTVEILGYGTEMRVEVAEPRYKYVRFGVLRVGQTTKKLVPIANRSPASLAFNLGITPNCAELRDPGVLKINPNGEIPLEGKGKTAMVEISFSPKTRIPQFSEEILMECAGMYQPLFVITGACHGIEIALDMDSIPFGAVVQRSSSNRKIIMINNGDIGAKFRWNIKKFAPDFSISPVEGYISPGMEVPFVVTFHPQSVTNDIRYSGLKCYIEGAKPLLLTLTGMCIAVPPVKEILNFTTFVRQQETKNLMVANKTNMHWDLRPVIDGEFYSGPETLVVEPQTTKGYELTYKPDIMTTEGRKHLGTVFFPLPDGTGMVYNVQGVADPPKASAKIIRDVPCKTTYNEILPVTNWLKKPQRFKVRFEMMRPDKLDPGTSIKFLDYIDVPGDSTKDYKVTFYAHKEGQPQLKLIFANEQTGEYQFYELTFRATRPGSINCIELTTPVRQSTQHQIKLENPLNYSVTFSAMCNIHEILMPNQLVVPARSTGDFNFEFLPLKTGEQQGKLEFTNTDLGLYTHDLLLRATVSGPERALYFRCCLGTSQVSVARFLNFAKHKTDYACNIDNTAEFHVEKTVTAAPGSFSGTEVGVEVLYEPTRIGESRGLLTAKSSVGGEYTFPLFATCIPPKPQGPFFIKGGSNTTIMFKNIFTSVTPFLFQVDNPLFHVAKSADNIKAGKDYKIVVGFDGNDSGSKAAVMAKLTVSCAKSAGGGTSCQWVYYLKGTTNEK